MEFYQQALAIHKEIGDKAGEGTTLTNIGTVYLYLRQYPKALELYEQALAILTEIGNKASKGTNLSNIGFLLEAQNQNITAASLTDLNTKPQRQLQVLAGAFATGHYNFTVGGEPFDFSGLPSAGVEVENLAKWSVSDGGTQALMEAFYTALENSNTTKAEALRQAQIALITGDYAALGKQRGLGVQQRIGSSLLSEVANRLSHPYYWAPFILIGNGL